MGTNGEAEQLEGVAVIGMAGRFPGAPSLARFWQNLVKGIESISTFSDAQLLAAGVDPGLLRLPNYVKAGVVLDGVDLFDADFFGFSPREAEYTDPQQRLFLECAWEALENAGYDPAQYTGQIGVFAGTGDSDYQTLLASNPRLLSLLPDLQRSIAVQKDFLATRVSYKLNLRGPSLSIQTACSTSLVAVHLGCQSLLNEESDMVLVGGVSIRVPQGAGHLHLEGGILSPDGHCRAFDAAAQGMVVGSGAGVVVLKRLADALADRDTIHAVIRGTAINNDGAAKAGYTAPSVDGQAGVIAEAQAVAGVTADAITYVEAHGTGTELGDPIEIEALTRAFRMSTQRKDFCAIGSVKTNIGHLDVAAGIAGLIKVALALEHKEIPPSVNFERPNPAIDFASSPFHVQVTHSKWAPETGRRLAGVSSFGIGGTNAHAVLEEGPLVNPSPPAMPWQLLTLSAKTPAALEKACDNLADFLAAHPDANLAEVAFTLQKGRKAFAHRRAMAARDNGDAVNLLRSREPRRIHTGKAAEGQPGVIFLFPAQGAQYVNMGRDLYDSEPVFREEIDRCAGFLKGPLGLDIRSVIYPENAEGGSEQLKQTRFTQPAVFVVDYALARLWMSWGVSPAAMAGHSLGEYVAATLAGVFELEDVLKLVAERARLMQEQPPGSMLAVYLGEPELKRWLSEEVVLAAVNASGLCVVSGPVESIKGINKALSSENIKTQLLQTSHAFHSGMMAPVVPRFIERVAQTPRRAPQIPVVSTLTGTWLTGAEAVDPAYWGRQLRHCVRFSPAIQELLKGPQRVFLEVGPGNTLGVLAKLHLPAEAQQLVLGSLRNVKETRSDRDVLYSAAGCLWVAGVSIDGEKLVSPEYHRRVPLPTYCFDRKRYWISPERVEAREYFRGTPASAAGRPSPSESLAHSAEALPPVGESPGSGVQVNGARHARPELANNYVAPQTSTETALARIWEHLLGVTGIGIHDDFFQLGGHSLLAVTLMGEIGKQFRTHLPLASLIQAPTIHSFAKLVEVRHTEPPWSSLVPLNSESAGPPLFLMHSHGGNVLEYYPLAQRLCKTHKVYALQARGLDGTSPENLSMEEMASYYLNEITAIQPAGPYYLGGYCFGGCLAIEAARQLRAQNKEVSLVTLINCSTQEYPKYLPETNSVRRFFSDCSARLALEWSALAGKSYSRKLAHLLARGRRLRDLAHARAEMFLDRWPALRGSLLKKHSMIYYWELLAMAHYDAWVAYQPKTYDGKVLFVRAQRQPSGIYPDPLLGWSEKLTGEVSILEVPGVHQTILSEPNVGRVASSLEKMLKQENSKLSDQTAFAQFRNS